QSKAWMPGTRPGMTNSRFVHARRSVARNSRRNGLRAHLLLHLRHPDIHRLAGRVLLDHRLGLGADRRGGLGQIERLAERLADMPGRGAKKLDPISPRVGAKNAPR